MPVSWWIWVLGTWAVLGGGVAVWFARALTEVEQQERRAPDASPGSPLRDDGPGPAQRGTG
jgi:hypothetical protein